MIQVKCKTDSTVYETEHVEFQSLHSTNGKGDVVRSTYAVFIDPNKGQRKVLASLIDSITLIKPGT